MATKDQLIEELVALGVEVDPDTKKADLEAMLEKAKADNKAESVVEEAPAPKPKKNIPGMKWVKVTTEDVMRLQAEHKLAGFNPATMEALINPNR